MILISNIIKYLKNKEAKVRDFGKVSYVLILNFISSVIKHAVKYRCKHFKVFRAVVRPIIGGVGGGGIFIYSCSARRISFESDCFYGM